MKQSVLLTIASMLSILFITLHLADDIVRGFEKGGPSNLLAVPIAVIWLYGTLVLAERRSGYVIVLLGSLLGAYVPYLHFKAAGGVAGVAGAAVCAPARLAEAANTTAITVLNKVFMLAPGW